jgi:hypothetical protein
MNYLKFYNNLINFAKARKTIKGQYYERHHIVPKCLGGSNEKTNIVKLTAREHYVAHQLLAKIYPDHLGLIFAAYSLSHDGNGQRISNRVYEWIKLKYISKLSEYLKENHPMKGKHHSIEAKEKMSKAKKGKPMSDDTKKKLKVYSLSDENWHRGKKRSAQTCENISKAKIGKKMSDETKTKCSLRTVGEKNPNFGFRKFPDFVYIDIINLKNSGQKYKQIQNHLINMGQDLSITSIKNLFFAYKECPNVI